MNGRHACRWSLKYLEDRKETSGDWRDSLTVNVTWYSITRLVVTRDSRVRISATPKIE